MNLYSHRANLLAIVTFGFFLRLINLNTAVWGDETASWVFAQQASFFKMWYFASYDPTPPLYYAVLYFVLPIIGDSPFSLRFPSLFFGTLIIPVTYWNMRQVSFSVNESLQASLLVASSSMLIYYSQEARSYSMLAFFGTLSVGVLFLVLKYPTTRNRFLYAFVIFIVSYIHPYGYFLVISQLIFLGFYRQWWVLFVASSSFSIVMLLLLLKIVNGTFLYGPSGDIVNGINLYSLISALNVGTLGMQYISKMPNAIDLRHPVLLINQVTLLVGFVISVLVPVLGVIDYNKKPVWRQKQFICLLSYCITIPVFCSIFVGSSFLTQPQWLLRGLIYIWPLYFMLVVALFSHPYLRTCYLVVFIVLNSLSLYPYYTNYSRFEYEILFDQLDRRLTEEDLIVVDPWYMNGLVDYYINKSQMMIGYDDALGWVDVEYLQQYDGYDSEKLLLSRKPTVRGEIYVYYKTTNIAWIDAYPSNPILVYDYELLTWRRLSDGQE